MNTRVVTSIITLFAFVLIVISLTQPVISYLSPDASNQITISLWETCIKALGKGVVSKNCTSPVDFSKDFLIAFNYSTTSAIPQNCQDAFKGRFDATKAFLILSSLCLGVALLIGFVTSLKFFAFDSNVHLVFIGLNVLATIFCFIGFPIVISAYSSTVCDAEVTPFKSNSSAGIGSCAFWVIVSFVLTFLTSAIEIVERRARTIAAAAGEYSSVS